MPKHTRSEKKKNVGRKKLVRKALKVKKSSKHRSAHGKK